MPGPIGTTPAVPANLPGIPSPATGVPSTPDFLTGLIQAGPQFTQGYQQGEQIQDERRKRALEDLQILSQQAVSNASDPGIIKSLTKVARTLRYDPKVFLSPDGKSVNTGALAQYNPFFQTAMQVMSNPNADPNVQEYFANLIGMKDFKAGGVSQKQFATDVKNFWDQYDKFSAGNADVNAVKAAGNTAYQEAMQRNDTVTANSIQQALANPQLGAKTQSTITHQTMQDQELGTLVMQGQEKVKQIQAQIKKTVADALVSQARVGLIHNQTIEAAHRVGLIDAQAYAAVQHVNIAAQNAQTARDRVTVAIGQLNSKNIKDAEAAVKDYNAEANNLGNHLTGLLNQETQLKNNGDWTKPDGTSLTPQATVIDNSIRQVRKLQQQFQPINPDVVTNRTMQNAGLPNTVKILPQSKPAQTKTISRTYLMQYARKHNWSLKDAEAKYTAEGYKITP